MKDAGLASEAAARRLRGLIVDTPLVGGVLLPGHRLPPELRLKVELLQTGGSVWFRGALHALMRRPGTPRGLVAEGGFREVLAAVVAAALHRIPVIAVLDRQVEAAARSLLAAAGADEVAFVRGGEQSARARGYAQMPGLGDADYDAGISTLGLELAAQLGGGVERVLVSPPCLAAPVQRGFDAAGRRAVVVGVDPRQAPCEELSGLRDALRSGARIDADADACAALRAGLCGEHGQDPCVILSG